jgi:cytochrome c biogenesis protein CcmG, thiol:disulfide interchange protein DsbE
MAKFSPIVALPPLVFLGFAALFMVGLNRENPNALPSMLQDQKFPEITVTPLGDLPGFTNDDLRKNEVKIVNFWASWCGPCRVEHPNITQLSEMGIPVYGVNYKDEAKNALAFLDELGNPYTGVGQDRVGRQSLDWGVYGLPETFVVDGEGRILLRVPGAVTGRVLRETVLPAIEKARANLKAD